jgi:mercuric ion binding protein
MKPTVFVFATAATLLVAGSSIAAEQKATIEVSGLFCSSCPYIAAQAVGEIASAEIVGGYYDPDLQVAQFVIQYDDEVTTLEALIGATEGYGYPARLIKDGGS